MSTTIKTVVSKAEAIGQRIIDAHERKLQRDQKMYPVWLAEGQNYKKIRLHSNLSISFISNKCGCCDEVIQRFENGRYIKRRTVIAQCYKLAMENYCRELLDDIRRLA